MEAFFYGTLIVNPRDNCPKGCLKYLLDFRLYAIGSNPSTLLVEASPRR